MFYDILERRNAFLGYKNKEVKNIEKLRFFQRGLSLVSVKNWPFCHVFIFGDIGQKNVFYNILERKNAFLGYKNKNFKVSKNWGFSKWVSLCFVQKWATSPSFRFWQYKLGKFFFTIFWIVKTLLFGLC